MTNAITRRALLTGLPASGAALMLPATDVSAESAATSPAVLKVLQELEAAQGWETAGVACTKAYAAYRLRQALGLDLPDPEPAQAHLHFQKGAWDSYTHSYWYERDQREGKMYTPPRAVL